MADTLRSVGLDIGTTTTQMVVSELTVENRASGFAVPSMEITGRKLLYESPVLFTPLAGAERVDTGRLHRLLQQEYRKAGITPEQVDTGAVIITGETSRKENARAVLEQMSSLAGEFVVATAGPDLESVLAARGAGAVAWSEQTGKTVLHMDIGGGTSNLALIRQGTITATFCLNVGGRLLKTEQGRICYLSPVVEGLTDLRLGDVPQLHQVEALAQRLVQALEMAAGLRERTELFHKLTTQGVTGNWEAPEEAVLSFSGGVADCIEQETDPFAYGDMGPVLGQAIRQSRLCQGQYRLGSQTIRATVIGAGCHSTQLSGSTVFYRNLELPLKNLPVVVLDSHQQEDPDYLRLRLQQQDQERVVLAMPGYTAPTYSQVRALASCLQTVGHRGVMVALQADMAKALGHSLCALLPPDAPCLCIDRVSLPEGSYLDIGTPVGPALPVVIKTLVFDR